ncbi:hypothetical protein SI65_08594 [Aspergillus cristatus]|uniref:HTH CENPB-type domain-containing protein n=1 Tax=Aspergillus cristatus TaxID=573508 RepID=A0A1E3B5C0_ASPCR|nr:hypothetical protein SI65_08594 [Aspergillus cristatus]
MANLLLAKRGSTTIETVGEKWVYNFTQRHPQLKSRFSQRYDYQRAKQEDSKVIQKWFDTIQRTITEHGILLENIYNFDETGFAMGLTATVKVITRAEYYGQRSVLQPGNWEWVTVIESISASGWALPPVIIFKGKLYNQAWFDGLPGDWCFEPLDIGCFTVLKRSYGSLIDQKMRCGTNHINKLDFLAAYPQAHMEAFKPDIIQNSFTAAGLVPFNPNQVLSKLNIRLRTPTPPGSRPTSRSSIFSPKTPANVNELLKQASSIKAFLKQRSNSPPTPSKTALNQLIKGCQIAMHNGILLEQENKQLRAENTVQKQKRAHINRHIAYEEDISVQGAQELIQAPEPIQEPPAPSPAQLAQPVLPAPAPARRRLPTCGKCSLK